MFVDGEVLKSLVEVQTWTAIGVAVLIVLHLLLLLALTWPTREERQAKRRQRRRARQVMGGRRPLDVVKPSTVDRVVETARRQGSHD